MRIINGSRRSKSTKEDPVGDGSDAFIVLTAVWGLAFWTFSDSKRNCVQCDVCNFHRFFYCVCDLIF